MSVHRYTTADGLSLFLDAFEAAEGPGWTRRRGYPDHRLFAGFPPAAQIYWHPVAADPRTLIHIRNEPSWRRIAGPQRSPDYAVAHMSGVLAEMVDDINAQGIASLPLPIILRPNGRSHAPWVILEGNKRVLAAVADGKPAIVCLAGEHPDLDRWHYYRDRSFFANLLQGWRDKRRAKRS